MTMTTQPNILTDASNLSVVEENTFGATTPPTSPWFNLDPNSYSTLGASYKKEPRRPISRNLQLRKGMLMDADFGLSIEIDVTKWLFDRFGNAMFRCAPKHSGGTGQSIWQVTAVTSDGYTVDALGGLAQRTLVRVRGCDNEENNGLFLVAAGSTGTSIKVASRTAETPSGYATIEVAGFRFAASDAELNSDGDLITTTKNCTQLGLNDEQGIIIGGREDANSFATEAFRGPAFVDGTITANKIPLSKRNWEVEQKASLDLGTLTDNLDTVVEARLSGAAGNDITVAATDDRTPAVKAELDLDTVTADINTVIRAKTAGVAGNLITVEIIGGAGAAAGVLTEVGTHVKLQVKVTATATTVAQLETLIGTSTLIEVKTPGTGATSIDSGDLLVSTVLAGGADAQTPTVTEVGDAVTLHYAPGFTTVAELEAVIDSDSTKIQVKNAGTASNVLVTTNDEFAAENLINGASGADDGDGKEIEIFFTRWYRHVPYGHADFRKPSFAFEYAIPELFDGEDGYLYMFGFVLGSAVFNLPTAGKATCTLTFVGSKVLTPTATRKTGPENAFDTNASTGLSTSIDLQRVRISDVDETGIAVDVESMKISFDNQVTGQKKLGKLGPARINQGDAMVSLESDVILTTSEIIAAVVDNRTGTADTLLANEDGGALLDIQALTFDQSDIKPEKGKNIMITNKDTGFQKKLSTASLSVFAFVPDAPEEDE
jgi:hypothetical protein